MPAYGVENSGIVRVPSSAMSVSHIRPPYFVSQHGMLLFLANSGTPCLGGFCCSPQTKTNKLPKSLTQSQTNQKKERKKKEEEKNERTCLLSPSQDILHVQKTSCHCPSSLVQNFLRLLGNIHTRDGVWLVLCANYIIADGHRASQNAISSRLDFSNRKKGRLLYLTRIALKTALMSMGYKYEIWMCQCSYPRSTGTFSPYIASYR